MKRTVKLIIATRRTDGAVEITTPTPLAMKALTNGGGIIKTRKHAKRQVEALVKEGHSAELAEAWVKGLCFGGFTDSEAYGLIRDKDVSKDCDAPELFAPESLPSDRWFRDAWRRAPEGGPVFVDLEAARLVQAERIFAALKLEETELEKAQLLASLTGQVAAKLSVDVAGLAAQILAAKSPEELKSFWPRGLAQPS